jgi:uncharacterized membrane protein HdeD (DUF308 family)
VTGVETAKTLALVGAILSIIFGTIYLLLGIVQVLTLNYPFSGYLGYSWIIYGILALIFGALTFLARKNLFEGDLRTGAILCFIFGGMSVAAIGGIVTIVAGILSIIAWYEQRRLAEAPHSPPPPSPAPPTVATDIHCLYCGAKLSPEASFCSSCGKKVKK